VSDTNPEWIQEPLPGLEPDYAEERAKRLHELREHNRELVGELHQVGGAIDSGSVALLQLQALLDLALSNEERTEFEVLFESRMGDALRDTVSALRKARLTAPMNPIQTKIFHDPRDPHAAGAFIGPS